MKLRTKFILFICVIHALTIGLSFLVFRQNKWYFLLSEFVILVSLAICWSLYRELIQPLQLLMRGIDAIHDRDFNVKFVKTGRYEMDRLIEVYNEMIDQLRTERTLQQEQHYFLEKLIHTAPMGILMLDFDDRIVNINPKALEWLKQTTQSTAIRELDSLLGMLISDPAHPVLQAIAALNKDETKTIHFDGAFTFKIRKAQFMDRGFARTFATIEELGIEILAAEKRSYGKVIRMMAHEVNNSIGAINSILDTTLQLHTGSPEVGEALQVAIDRNDHLNRFMRNFADVIRLPEPHLGVFDLHDLLRKTAQLMEYKTRERAVQFQWNLASTPLLIRADAGQLEQVLINVIKNALEAIDHDGTIHFTTIFQPPQLIIADNGKGLPAGSEEQIFTPFFTNKNGGQGIGLTLAREILGAHGFVFSLRTEADGWTRFEVRFGGNPDRS